MPKLLDHLCLSTHALCSPSSPTELGIGAYRVVIDDSQALGQMSTCGQAYLDRHALRGGGGSYKMAGEP